MTDEQKKAFGEKMKAIREAKKAAKVKEVAEVTEPVVKEVKSSKIVLHFNRNVEVFINGKPYIGKDIEVDDMVTASEIVRIAKEAYGWEVMTPHV